MIHSENPVFENNVIDEAHEIKWNDDLKTVKWITLAIAAPIFFCLGLMVGMYVDNLNADEDTIEVRL